MKTNTKPKILKPIFHSAIEGSTRSTFHGLVIVLRQIRVRHEHVLVLLLLHKTKTKTKRVTLVRIHTAKP